jgi:hypothetical protein
MAAQGKGMTAGQVCAKSAAANKRGQRMTLAVALHALTPDAGAVI